MEKEVKSLSDWFEIQTPQGPIHFPTNLVYCSINISGGFDSWVMAYLFLHSLRENKNFDIHIYPTHVIRTNKENVDRMHRLDTKPNVLFIVQQLRKDFPEIKNLHDPIFDYVEYWWTDIPILDASKTWQWQKKHAGALGALDFYVQQQFKEVHKRKINEHQGILSWCHLNASNLAPVGFIENSVINYRNTVEKESLVTPTSMSGYYNSNKPCVMPFRNLDKRTVYWLAEKYNQLTIIDSYAWTCESNEHGTYLFTKPCNSCWQCKERNWARENYKNL